MPTSPVESLLTAASALDSVLAGVGAGQWLAPTPCPEWTVSALTDHVIGGNRLFASALRGDPRPPSRPSPPDDGGDGTGLPDRLAAFRRSIDELHEAFTQPGALDRIVSVPFGEVPGAVALHLRVVELVVHGWDLAQATAQRLALPDEVVRPELEFARQALTLVPPDRNPFGPPQPAGQNPSALNELVALLGRAV